MSRLLQRFFRAGTGLLALAAFAAQAAEPGREPCTDVDPLRRPFFGDTHVHTNYSFDANSQDTRNTPRDAYRFAKGDPLVGAGGGDRG